MAVPRDLILRPGGLQTPMRVVRGRWFVIAVGIVVMIASAGAYSFGIYSQRLKSALNIDQETLNIIANFKDLGVNLGLPAGLLYDYSSPKVVLIVGALETVAGYLLAWLSVTRRIPPSVWQMCLFLFIGANSQAMLNTAVLVQAVKLFPANKGVIISLMKGYIGVSGAILIQIYIAIQGSAEPESFLLMLVWLPSTVALLSIFVIRPLNPFRGLPDVKHFYWFLALGFALAFYLMAVVVAQSLTNIDITGKRVIGCVLLIVLAIPLFAITYRSEVHGKKSIEEGSSSSGSGVALEDIEAGSEKKVKEQPSTLTQEDKVSPQPKAPESLKSNDELLVSENEKAQVVTNLTTNPALEDNPPGTAVDVQKTTPAGGEAQIQEPPADEANVSKRWKMAWSQRGEDHSIWQAYMNLDCWKAWPQRGEDHTIWQGYGSLDFWLVFVTTMIGVGSGLTATDNMGQLGLSLGYSQTRVHTFVSLLSIWNSIGRWVGGFLSEILLHQYGTPRPKFQTVALALMALSYLLIALNVPGCLYFGSILLGLSFGAQFPIYTTIIAEVFGLKYFGTLYNTIGIACPVGMYMLSVPVAGKLYDAEARRQAGPSTLLRNSKDLLCHGSLCFRTTFLILMAVTLGATGVAGFLWYRTRHFYRQVHESYQVAKAEESAQLRVEWSSIFPCTG